MVKRTALVIGPEVAGLQGVANDVEMMSNALAGRGFAVRRCAGAAATRVAILAALDDLIADTEAGDCVVITVSSHGGLLVPPAGVPTDDDYLHFFEASDSAQSTPSIFLGVLGIEVSVRLAQLTARTDNVAVIVDACYAQHLWRSALLRPKSLPRITYTDIEAHIARLRNDGLQTQLLSAAGNANAVRLVASGPGQLAVEYRNSDGIDIGVLTESFCIALRETEGLPVSWATLVGRIRARTVAAGRGQRAEVEGPADRVLFETGPAAPMNVLQVVPFGTTRVKVLGATLLGFGLGDKFELMQMGADVLIGIATVSSVEGATAVADVTYQPNHKAVPAGVVAHPRSVAARRWPVVVRGSGAVADLLRTRVAGSSLVRAPERANELALATVEADMGIVVMDEWGDVVSVDGASVDDAVVALELMARASTLRTVAPPAGEALADQVAITWGLVVEGEERPLPRTGALVHVGEHVFIRLRNDAPLIAYVHVLAIGMNGEVKRLLPRDPSGRKLSRGEDVVIGADLDKRVVGVPMVWPTETRADAPRPETVLVIVTNEAEDLAVQQPGRRAVRTTLQRMLDQAEHGSWRDLRSARRGASRFSVHRVDFQLSPVPAPAVENTEFRISEMPDRSALLAEHGTGNVVVRMPVFPASLADERLDVLVLTGGGKAHTWSGKVSETQDAVLYSGGVQDRLDIACWAGSGAAELPSALTIGSVSPGHGAHAVAVSEVDWVARTVDAAQEALAPRPGIYRATFLPSEGFGVGLHGQEFVFSVESV